MKTILLSLFLLTSLFITAQNAEYIMEYAKYKKAIEIQDYNKALEHIEFCINSLEREGVSDTTYSNALFEKAYLFFRRNLFEDAFKFGEKAFEIEKGILGENHLYVANSHDFFSRLYSSMGANDSLVIYNAKKALEIRRRLLGEEHPNVAVSLNNLGWLLYEMGNYEETMTLFEQSLNVRKKVLGEEHPDVAVGINNLGEVYFKMGKYKEAMSLFEKSLNLRKKVLGKEHPDVGYSLHNLATTYSEINEYEKAIPLFEQSLSIKKKSWGAEHYYMAISLTNLAYLYLKMGLYEKAIPLYEHSLKIRRKEKGENHPMIAASLNDLARLYSDKGQYEKAIQLNEEALQIYKNAFGERHQEIAATKNAIAIRYSKMGKYEMALKLNEEALQLFKMLLGEEDASIAPSLNNLAMQYEHLGQYEKAIPLYEQALKIFKKSYSEYHPDYATSLNNLAGLYLYIGQYEEAISLCMQALEIREELFKEDHPDVAESLASLASMYSTLGQHEEALPIFEQALRIKKKTVTEEHPSFATSLNSLANSYSSVGNYENALPLLKQSLRIRKKVFRDKHPDVAITLKNLAALYISMGQYKNALPFLEQALQIFNHQLASVLPSLTIDQKINYLKLDAFSYKFYDALVLDHQEIKEASTRFSFNNSLLLGNLTLRSNEAMRNSILNSNDSILIENFENWLGLKRQYANAQAMSLEEIKNKSIDITALEDSIETKERSLSMRSQVFQTDQQKLQLNFETVKSRLAKDEAFVMFHSFDYHNGKSWTDSVLYSAYVVRSNQKEPAFIKLFEQRQLDSLMLAPDVTSMMSNLYQPSDSALYNLIWKPISGNIGEAKKLYIAPSGQLHKLAFAAIGDGEGHVLSDKYEIHQVLSAQDFVYPSSPVVFNKDDKATTPSIAMFGGINYDPSKSAASEKDSILFSPLSLLSKDLDRGSSFGYLPATQKEIESIQIQFKQNNKTTLSYSGLKATESALRALEGDKAPRILHIATHGYFAPDPREDHTKTQMRIMGQENRYTESDNPLLRSGLMMAGSNDAWLGKVALPGEEDGILTAQEVSNLNLLNTQLVVLSACETALGDVKGREGVFGLQRAFRLAGAKYLLLSLWRIPDEETSEYMQLFYSELLKQNDITKAYKTTQSSMRHKYPNSPMKWAGMVLVE